MLIVGSILYIVKTRPEVAVMEGMELVQYKQITLSAKGYSPPDSVLPPIPDPLKLPEPEGESGKKENG